MKPSAKMASINAHVVSKVAYGGPITDVGAGWYGRLCKGSDPRDKNNVLVRAMLGNQKDFFEWFKESDQRSKTVDEAKALIRRYRGTGEGRERRKAGRHVSPQLAVFTDPRICGGVRLDAFGGGDGNHAVQSREDGARSSQEDGGTDRSGQCD
ncbi:hypothetical protein ACU4HD_47840 [Cupriavidus basilensis]